MQVTKKEVYESKSQSDAILKAEVSAKEQTSEAQETSQTISIADSQNQIKGAVDFANAKKFDGQLQASLLKERLLDVNREGNLEGLQNEAKKATGEDVGVIKDNLGKDIARHEGPGIDDMYKKSKKYEMPDRDPLAGLPKTEKQEKDAKKAPDMPFKPNDDWAKDDNLKGLLPNVFGQENAGGKTPLESNLEKKAELGVPNAKELDAILGKAGVYDAAKKAGNKYSDPDQVGTTEVEKPKEPPPNSKDLLGHKVNPLNNDPIIDTENVDIAKVVKEHKGPDKTLIYTDPDQQEQEFKFDAANPPQMPGNELKNTGNPIDNAEPMPQKAPTTEPEGGQPHTDGTISGGSGTKVPIENEDGTIVIGGNKK